MDNLALISKLGMQTCIPWYSSYGLLLTVITIVQGNVPNFVRENEIGLIYLPKYTPNGTAIYRFQALDTDGDYPLTFDAQSESTNGAGLVQIKNIPDNQSELLLIGDPQIGQTYYYRISVKDSRGEDPTSLRIGINITNSYATPDNVFLMYNRSAYFTVKENTPVDTCIGNIRVRGKDDVTRTADVQLQLQGSIKFKLIDQLERADRMKKANICVKEALDYETENVHHLTLIAWNGYIEESVDTRNIMYLPLIISVLDEQDTPPVFTKIPSIVHVSSDLQVGGIILDKDSIEAVDGDTDNKNEIRYSLIDAGSQYFGIDSRTGEISLDDLPANIYKANDGKPLTIGIKADEVGQSGTNSSTVQHIVVIFDPKESQPPVFDKDMYEAEVEEHSPAFSLVTIQGTTRIKDEDLGTAGVFTLHLENEIEDQMVEKILEIDPPVIVHDGEFQIRVKNSDLLDYEHFHELKFKLVAKEISTDPKTSSASVTIHIRDINDNLPVFSEDIYYAEMPEDAKADTVIAQISAQDPDSGDYGKIKYTKITGDAADKLKLDPSTGLITLATSDHGFDREVKAEHEFKIEVSDSGDPPKLNTAILHLKLLDVNDNAPEFTESQYEAVVRPDTQQNKPFMQLTAIDADEPGTPNSMVRYELEKGHHGVFKINEDTGELSLNEPIPEGEYPYPLTVRAYDMGVPSKFNIVKVSVYSKNPAFTNVTIKYIYPATVTAVEQDKTKIERFLTLLNGANTIISDTLLPYNDDQNGIQKRSTSEKTLITATVQFLKRPGPNDVVDLSNLAKEFNATTTDTSSVSTVNIAGAETGWKVALITIIIILIIILLILLCYCAYRQTRRLEERKIHPEDDKNVNDKNSQVIEVATLEQGLSESKTGTTKLTTEEKLTFKGEHKNRTSIEDEVMVTNGGFKRNYPPADSHDDRRRLSADLSSRPREPHVSYSRHLHGRDSQINKDVTGNSLRVEPQTEEDVVEELEEDYVDSLPSRARLNAATSNFRVRSDRLGQEFADNSDNEIEEIIVIEPDGHGSNRGTRRVRRIIKRSPARPKQSVHIDQRDTGEWSRFQLPRWAGKIANDDYIEEYDVDDDESNDGLGKRRVTTIGRTSRQIDDTGRRVIVRKFRGGGGGGSLPGDRYVGEAHYEKRFQTHESDGIGDDEDVYDTEHFQDSGRGHWHSRHRSIERPKHRFRDRRRALTRTSFRVEEEDSEDDLIDFRTNNNEGYLANENEIKQNRTIEANIQKSSKLDFVKSKEKGSTTDIGIGSASIEGRQANVQDELDKERNEADEQHLVKVQEQELIDNSKTVKLENDVASQTTETDNKGTQTQARLETVDSNSAEVKEEEMTTEASDEFDFTIDPSNISSKDTNDIAVETNHSPRSEESTQTETSSVQMDSRNDSHVKQKNKPIKPKGGSRYMDWYNKGGSDRGTNVHKAHCEKTLHTAHSRKDASKSHHSPNGDENIADETKAAKKQVNDANTNDRHHRRVLTTDTNVLMNTKTRSDNPLDVMDNEMRLGGNHFVAEDDEDSGIGHTDSFKTSKKQFLEKQSLFTIAYNGMQNKQDALKDRETSATANRVAT